VPLTEDHEMTTIAIASAPNVRSRLVILLSLAGGVRPRLVEALPSSAAAS
jgi:hypothetical protein